MPPYHPHAPNPAVAKPQTTPLEPFTPVPNNFIDKLMPTLKDTEWRLLCVVTRQTLGWQAGSGQRKARDWLTQRQLVARTGRHSAAISAALDTLVRRQLIAACAVNGELLLTPQQRQRHQGRIFYGLCQRPGHSALAGTKSELQKANTTKETKDKRKINKGSAEKDKSQFKQGPLAHGQQRNLVHYTGWTRAAVIAAAHLATAPSKASDLSAPNPSQ